MTEIRLEKSLPSEQERVGQPSVPAEGLERYFAREGVDPLPYAFEGKIAVHPGLGGSGVEKQDFEATLEPLLAEPRTGKTVAYIHVPFCETHCLYCGFYNKAYREDESRIYADALIQELRLWRGRPGQDAGPVHAVYMGGGTPTALQAGDLRRILKEVRAVLPLANDCEITVEGRLSNFGPDKMEACFEGGANRGIWGADMVKLLQKLLEEGLMDRQGLLKEPYFTKGIRMGRVSDRDTLIRQLQLLQSYDQAAVIVDLIYGFPMQTMERWLADIATAQSLKLDGADCYQLNVYRNTPLAKAIESGRLPAGADIPMQSAMFAAGVKAMQKGFYRRLSISHWARTSRERNLYNLYVKGRAHCLAFGPGAGGNLDGFFYLNQSGTFSKSVVNISCCNVFLCKCIVPTGKDYRHSGMIFFCFYRAVSDLYPRHIRNLISFSGLQASRYKAKVPDSFSLHVILPLCFLSGTATADHFPISLKYLSRSFWISSGFFIPTALLFNSMARMLG